MEDDIRIKLIIEIDGVKTMQVNVDKPEDKIKRLKEIKGETPNIPTRDIIVEFLKSL